MNWIDPSGQNPLAIIGIGALFGGTLAFLNTLAAEAQSGGFANVQQAFGHAFVAAGIGAIAGAGATAAAFAFPTFVGTTAFSAIFSGLGNLAYQSLSKKCGNELNLTSFTLAAAVGAAGGAFGFGIAGSFAGGPVAQAFATKLSVAGGLASPFGMLASVVGTAYPVTFGQVNSYLQMQLNNMQNFIQEMWVLMQTR